MVTCWHSWTPWLHADTPYIGSLSRRFGPACPRRHVRLSWQRGPLFSHQIGCRVCRGVAPVGWDAAGGVASVGVGVVIAVVVITVVPHVVCVWCVCVCVVCVVCMCVWVG